MTQTHEKQLWHLTDQLLFIHERWVVCQLCVKVHHKQHIFCMNWSSVAPKMVAGALQWETQNPMFCAKNGGKMVVVFHSIVDEYGTWCTIRDILYPEFY